MAQLEQLISEKIVSIIDTDVPEVEKIVFDTIRLNIDDFRDHELPAVQIIDLEQIIEHQRGFERVAWLLAIDVIMKSTAEKPANQVSLWELRHKIQIALWDKPNLQIPGVIHLRYKKNLTDLHLLQPYYIATMEFEALFRRPLTGSC